MIAIVIGAFIATLHFLAYSNFVFSIVIGGLGTLIVLIIFVNKVRKQTRERIINWLKD